MNNTLTLNEYAALANENAGSCIAGFNGDCPDLTAGSASRANA